MAKVYVILETGISGNNAKIFGVTSTPEKARKHNEFMRKYTCIYDIIEIEIDSEKPGKYMDERGYRRF